MGEVEWVRQEFRPLGHLHWPTFHRYRVGQPRRFAVTLNRYPFSVIGLGFVIGGWCVGVKWARPARYGVKGVDT